METLEVVFEKEDWTFQLIEGKKKRSGNFANLFFWSDSGDRKLETRDTNSYKVSQYCLRWVLKYSPVLQIFHIVLVCGILSIHPVVSVTL